MTLGLQGLESMGLGRDAALLAALVITSQHKRTSLSMRHIGLHVFVRSWFPLQGHDELATVSSGRHPALWMRVLLADRLA